MTPVTLQAPYKHAESHTHQVYQLQPQLIQGTHRKCFFSFLLFMRSQIKCVDIQLKILSNENIFGDTMQSNILPPPQIIDHFVFIRSIYLVMCVDILYVCIIISIYLEKLKQLTIWNTFLLNK
jgi:hypothetical protein